MRKIILFIASSLDNYIARENGDVDWLFHDRDYGYSNFIESINTTLMGNKTYKQILTFGNFPYKGKRNYVFTKQQKLPEGKYIEYINQDVINFVEELKREEDKDIWLVGGAEIINLFLKYSLIDELIISIHPIILGKGISLFRDGFNEVELKLININQYDTGLLQVHYHLIYK